MLKKLPIKWIQPPPALLDYPVANYWNKELFSKNNLIQFFILNKQFLSFSYFFARNIFIYFVHLVLTYNHENKLNRNVHNTLRRNFFWNTWLQIKLSQIKNFYFSIFLWIPWKSLKILEKEKKSESSLNFSFFHHQGF